MRKRVVLEVTKDIYDRISLYITECTGAKVIQVQTDPCEHDWYYPHSVPPYCKRCWADMPAGEVVVKVEDVEEEKVTECDDYKRELAVKLAEHKRSFEELIAWVTSVAGYRDGTERPAPLLPCPFCGGDQIQKLNPPPAPPGTSG